MAHREVDVRVIPGASRDEVVGWHDGALKVKTAAPPEAGKANRAVRALLQRHFGLPRRAVQIVAGETSPRKRVRLEEADAG